MCYYIIIFSRLQSYGGGRETWINMFLPLLKKSGATNIEVYFFSDNFSDKARMINAFKDKNYNFNEITLPPVKNRLFSIYRIILFCVKTIRSIRVKTKNDGAKKRFFLGIGSFYEAFTLMIYKMLFSKPLDCFVVWLRGIWAKETLARHKGLIHSLIVKFEKFFLKRADVIIANGDDTALEYKKYGFNSVVIPNAIDLNKYKDVRKLKESNRKKISYIGRLSLEKGIVDFLESIKKFNQNFPTLKDKISFEIVGDGPLREKVKEYSKISNLKYLGAIENNKIIDYIETIDCGVALTYSKKDLGGAGVSNGLLELMASGRGIICWDSPVFQQVLDDNSAFMVKESCLENMILAYKEVIDSFDKVIKKGEKALMEAKKFSKEKHIKKFIEVIDEIQS